MRQQVGLILGEIGDRLRQDVDRAELMQRGRRHALRALAILLLIPAAVLILGGAAFGALVSLLAIPVLPTIAVVVMCLGIVPVGAAAIAWRRSNRVIAPGTAPLPGRALGRDPQRVWQHAVTRFHRLRGEFAGFECDPMQVLRLPALVDVTVPSTERFIDALSEAQSLDTDDWPGEQHATQFVAAVDRAERSWKAARQAAERIRLSGLDPAERSAVERIIRLLTTARDSDNEPERLSAYARARDELAKLDRAGVLHLPLPARAALDEAARGRLAPTPTVGMPTVPTPAARPAPRDTAG